MTIQWRPTDTSTLPSLSGRKQVTLRLISTSSRRAQRLLTIHLHVRVSVHEGGRVNRDSRGVESRPSSATYTSPYGPSKRI